ncbi:hypothetical protein, partial [Mycobacterium nebraskense]|uniref:hypothetical protein n=1 Tax=Mycobacterium nebraskense TaxID=244292 RepID=UPI001ABFA56B
PPHRIINASERNLCQTTFTPLLGRHLEFGPSVWIAEPRRDPHFIVLGEVLGNRTGDLTCASGHEDLAVLQHGATPSLAMNHLAH